MSNNDRPSPVALLVGGLLALIVGIIVVRFVLGTILFLGKVALVIALVALVVSAMSRGSRKR